MKTGQKILIGALIGGTIMFGATTYLKFFRNRKAKKMSKTPSVNSHSEIKVGKSLVLTPDSEFSKYDLIVVYGGMHFATPAWMKKQIPDSILNRNIVVIVPYNDPWSRTIGTIKKATEGKNIGRTSLLGYSGGGYMVLDVMQHLTPSFIGLIDPSIHMRQLQFPVTKNFRMLWGSPGMIDIFEDNGQRYTKMEKKIKDAGGVSQRSSDSNHGNYPKAFFRLYEKELNA